MNPRRAEPVSSPIPKEKKKYTVSKGRFSGSISIEVTQEYDIALDLRDLKVDGNEVKFVAVWDPTRNRGLNPTKRQFTAYNSSGVKIDDGNLIFGGSITSFEPTEGYMLFINGIDRVSKIKIE